ncbi:MAG: hypothetical protein OWQ48_00475 [Desulfurococcus sp.]|nr:hypothetical protein [Desulfurococcus sp.]
MAVLGWLVSVVYKAFFLKGDTGFKRAHWTVKVLYIAILTLIIARGDLGLLLGALLVSLALGLISPGYEWVLSTLTLSSIVSAYMSLTSLIASLAGFSPVGGYWSIVFIALRTLSLSTIIAFSFVIISPLEISSLLILLGAGRLAGIPLLVWRLIPYGLKSFSESLGIGYVKGERVSQRIPPAVASVIEIGGFIEEYCFYKLNSKAKRIVLPEYTWRHTAILALSSVILMLLLAAQ